MTTKAVLQESETRFRTLIEHSMDVVTIVGPDGRMAYMSPSVTRLLGYGPLELVGKVAFDYIHPDDLAQTQAAFANALVADTAEIREEFRFRHKDGSWREFEAVVTNLLRDPAVAGLVINSRDITKRRAAEAALRASETRFRTLAGMAPVGIFCTDPQGLGTYFNDRLLEILGLTPEEAAGMGWMRSIHPDDRERVTAELAHARATGQPWRSEHRAVRHDGAVTWVLVQSAIERDDAARVIGTIGTITDITTLRLQTQALRESEERYRAVAQSASDAIVTVDGAGKVVGWNRAAERLFGYVEAEVIGQPAVGLMPVRYREAHLDGLKRVAGGGERRAIGRTVELEGLRKDGSEFPVELSLAQWEVSSGGFYTAIIRDITQRKAAENALAQEQILMRTVMDTVPDFIYFKDRDSHFVRISKALAQLFGLSDPAQAVGKTDFDFFTREHAHQAYDDEQAIMRTGQLLTKEERETWADRPDTWVSTTKVPLHDKRGNVLGTFGISRSITDRKRTEEALALKTTVLETQQETSLDGILVEDGHGKMISFNQPFIDLWDIPPEVAASGSIEHALQWVTDKLADPDGFMARVAHLWAHHEEKSREEIALKDGRTLDRYSASMFGADGTYYGRVWYFRDITALKRAQMDQERALSEAEQASRTKSGFLANMSHELRTPLNSIIGFASLLAQSRAGVFTAEDLDFLGRIENNGKHLLEIINSILDLSKIEAGKIALEITDVPLDQLVRETLGLIGGVQEGHGRLAGAVELREQVPPGLRPIRADAGKLKQVLINLVGNALKFTERGSVTVRVVADPATGEAERIDVVDTGIGIPKERQAAIFEAFEQADATTARRYHGSGLGLTISRTLLQQMGYSISVASEVGKGSTFSVRLRGAGTRYGALEPVRSPLAHAGPAAEPVSVTTAAAAPPLADSPDKTEFCGYTVLVIDDDADSRLLLNLMIGGHGATVLTASSGEEALQLARAVRPDLVTVDVVMPQMSGWEVIKALREDSGLRAIPALVVSVVADAPEGALVGAEDRLNKPVNQEALLAALRRHLPRGGKAA